jgi:peroxisomal coenzyme A diphosphatase NUDT7
VTPPKSKLHTSPYSRQYMAAAAMRPLLTRLFASIHIAMISSFPPSSSSYPSRRLVRLTRHLTRHLTSSSSSGELTSVDAPAAAADVVPPRSRPATSKVHAAVLVCLFEDPSDGPRVILTKRASSLSTHSGKTPRFFA